MVFSNIIYFHPYLGKIPILTNIFQMGWNHQLDTAYFEAMINTASGVNLWGSPIPKKIWQFLSWWFSTSPGGICSFFWRVKLQQEPYGTYGYINFTRLGSFEEMKTLGQLLWIETVKPITVGLLRLLCLSPSILPCRSSHAKSIEQLNILYLYLDGGFKHVLFSPLLGEDSHFD